MRPSRYCEHVIVFLILLLTGLPAFSQMGISFDIKKPKEYDERVLRSEKSADKKFTLPRRLIQNTVTHYNYTFNATNKLNEVLERAKSNFTDDYSKLLPFYNYSLDVTQQDSVQLDSVTYKASTGIILHDLRNDWIDNLYLLWGASYYLQKDFDSAYLMFQFINYAFAPKEKDGYYLTIGSNRDGNSAASIATREKGGMVRKTFSEPPSRNDAFIWQIRNFLAQDEFAEAASLIVALREDPFFPKRLQNDLHEVQAYWFYKQNMWDSAASHLVQALSNATNQQEKARWEYLAGQLYELAGNYTEAEKYFNKVIGHTTDLVLEIYARLSTIRVNRDGGDKTIEKNVAELLKMAKRDKYEEYRDIIYYMAAQMLMEGKDVDGALALLLKSTEYKSENIAHRNKAFLQLAEISYGKKQYRNAYNFYDSLRLDDPALPDTATIMTRKRVLGTLAMHLETAERQDSLQRIAALPEEERKDFVRKIVKQLRKQQGLKDETLTTGNSIITPTTAPVLFPADEPKGEWYFYNPSSRTRGQNEFRVRWGNRPNVDNWRRSATLIAGMTNPGSQPGMPGGINTGTATGEATFDGLYGNLPITPEQMKVSNDSLSRALFELGKAYIHEIEDCNAGTETLEQLRSRFPEFQPMDETLFSLYYCYNKQGDAAKAAAIKKLMTEKFGSSNYTTIVTTGKNPQAANNPDATQTYEQIYDLFIEGNFTEAVSRKKQADSRYGKNYWSPQLLYIEAVYYIRQRDDSTARTVLTNLVTQFPSHPLAVKAATMMDVLGRRAQIEEELSRMVVTRNDDGNPPPPPVITPPVTQPKKDSVTTKPVVPPPVTVKNPGPKDTLVARPVVPAPKSSFVYAANEAHYVVLVLNKVDPVFVNEAKNAFFRYNRETFYNKNYSAELTDIDPENRLLLIAPFANEKEAMDYIDKTRPRTATEIIPWLKGGKYSFTIITAKNLETLRAEKNIEAYRNFLNQHLPGRF